MSENNNVIELLNIKKIYKMGTIELEVLRGISLSVKKGEHISIMGPSGSGKTTLLNILGCLDKPTYGQYFFQDKDISKLDDNSLSEIRSKYIGFIFQQFNLIPQLNVIENISLPLFYQGIDENLMMEKAKDFADMVGLSDRLYHRPSELSGGQQQRVAIARALANDPLIILADEPTGNLDTTTGKEIMKLLCRLNEEGKTLLVITHDINIANYSKRIIKLLDGRIVNES
ncbi:MAG TPA: ABC transporter ATP-binding protein [Candidatus Ratteibacteria bacterium]|nr:ABC transporter ATP-binding protein [bacterium]HRR95891.1 ABC transporter ATP-binding protein [Candidatus Ratteibacteria bacterium]